MNETHRYGCDSIEDRAMFLAKERQAEIVYVNALRIFGRDSAEAVVAGQHLDRVRKHKLPTP